MATTQARDKYYLRTLHEDIALFDRKIAHLTKYDTFATDKERDAAAGKLSNKREQLVKTAKQLVEEGVEFKPSELPPSLRTADMVIEETAPVESTGAAPATVRVDHPAVAIHDSSALNFRNEMKEYLEKRKKSLSLSN